MDHIPTNLSIAISEFEKACRTAADANTALYIADISLESEPDDDAAKQELVTTTVADVYAQFNLMKTKKVLDVISNFASRNCDE